MRKRYLFSFTLAVMLSLLLCSAASADVVTAKAVKIDPEHLEKTSCYARIVGYDQEKDVLTVELIAPETFSGEEIASLKAGDSILTGGREVKIGSISADDEWCGTLFINDGALFLFQERSGDYTMMSTEDDCVWNTVAVVECPVMKTLLFLDGICDDSGEALQLPKVYTARELTAQLLEKGAENAYTVGLTANNVYAVFDGEGNLAAIHRFYVPWQ